MVSDFVRLLPERSRQACSGSGRQLLIANEQLLSELEQHLDERGAVILLRNLAATPCRSTRQRLRRFLSPLLSLLSEPTNLHFQALCNLVQDYPEHARLVYPNVSFTSAFDNFDAARALLFACIRCDDSCFAAFLESRDLLLLAMNLDRDDLEWPFLTVQLLLRRSSLNRLLSLPAAQLCFTLEALESCLQSGAEIIAFAAAVVRIWRDDFCQNLLAQRSVPEDQLDVLYSAVSLLGDAAIVPGAVIDADLASVALDLLAACGTGDGPKPTQCIRDDIPTTPQSMKAILVRLLANLAAVDDGSRRRIAQDDALVLLLNHTKIDDQNPFIREWVIVAIRHLTANDADVQKRIAELEPTSFQTVPVQI